LEHEVQQDERESEKVRARTRIQFAVNTLQNWIYWFGTRKKIKLMKKMMMLMSSNQVLRKKQQLKIYNNGK